MTLSVVIGAAEVVAERSTGKNYFTLWFGKSMLAPNTLKSLGFVPNPAAIDVFVEAGKGNTS
jgi:hypothetical protein